MCLYPKLILNKKYLPTKKNGYNPPQLTDLRLKYVPVGCGNCIECKKQKSQEWRVRLQEELKSEPIQAYFVTLTFAPEELDKLCKECKLSECNAVAGKAVRRMLERYRKKYKKSFKHWLITELGHEGTERIHLHGIVWITDPNDTKGERLSASTLESLWQYGGVYVGEFCNAKTINYVIKYMLKVDTEHKNFKQQIFCSAGLGKGYLKTAAQRNIYNGEDTKETIVLNNGQRVNLPIYYRNHIYTEEQREKLWLQKIEEHTIYVMGTPIRNIHTEKGRKLYEHVLKVAQQNNIDLGYGDNTDAWKASDYNITLRMLNKEKKYLAVTAHKADTGGGLSHEIT